MRPVGVTLAEGLRDWKGELRAVSLLIIYIEVFPTTEENQGESQRNRKMLVTWKEERKCMSYRRRLPGLWSVRATER
jgi:hypothetical protein